LALHAFADLWQFCMQADPAPAPVPPPLVAAQRFLQVWNCDEHCLVQELEAAILNDKDEFTPSGLKAVELSESARALPKTSANKTPAVKLIAVAVFVRMPIMNLPRV
jgi:hypothetical protein